MKKKDSRRQIPTRISKHQGFMLFTFGLPSELRFFSSFAQFCSNLSMWSNPSLGELRKRDKKWPTAPFLYCFLYTFYPSWIKDESNLLQGPLSFECCETVFTLETLFSQVDNEIKYSDQVVGKYINSCVELTRCLGLWEFLVPLYCAFEREDLRHIRSWMGFLWCGMSIRVFEANIYQLTTNNWDAIKQQVEKSNTS